MPDQRDHARRPPRGAVRGGGGAWRGHHRGRLRIRDVLSETRRPGAKIARPGGQGDLCGQLLEIRVSGPAPGVSGWSTGIYRRGAGPARPDAETPARPYPADDGLFPGAWALRRPGQPDEERLPPPPPDHGRRDCRRRA